MVASRALTLEPRPLVDGAPSLTAPAAPNLVPHPTFDADSTGDGVPDGWYVDAPRAALRPVFGLDERGRRAGHRAATAKGGGNALCFGKWGQVVPVMAGRHYRAATNMTCITTWARWNRGPFLIPTKTRRRCAFTRWTAR